MAPSRRQIGLSRVLCCALPARAAWGFLQFASLVIIMMLQAGLWPGSRGSDGLQLSQPLGSAGRGVGGHHRSIACFC